MKIYLKSCNIYGLLAVVKAHALEVIDPSNGLEALLIPLGKILSKLFMVRMMNCKEEIFRIHLDVVGRCTPKKNGNQKFTQHPELNTPT
jgi:hypothetical protein